MVHTILGAGGFAGDALANELFKHKDISVRLVSRNPKKIKTAMTYSANLLSKEETIKAVSGSAVVYLCVGLKYSYRVWQLEWPQIMQNTIYACKKANAKLVFLDVVYMYGKVVGEMTEQTPYKPCSKKGEVRAKVAKMLEDEMKQGELKAIIARSADVYGPFAGSTSLPHLLVIDKLLKSKKAQCLVDDCKLHSYTYTLDMARGMWILANHDSAINQIWHLPTFKPAIDCRSFAKLVANELSISAKNIVLKKSMIRFAGLFAKKYQEVYEMLYQSEFDYRFDSSKFERQFNYSPMSYRDGVAETIRFLRKQSY